MKKLIILVLLPSILTAWFIISFQQKLTKGALPPVNPRFSGEVLSGGEESILTEGIQSIEHLSLSNNGNRLIFVSGVEGKIRKLMLWESGSRYLTLTDETIKVEGNPVISGNGLKVAFLAKSTVESNGQASLYIWEDGFGNRKILDNIFVGSWNLAISAFGNRVVAIPAENNARLKLENNPLSSALIIDFYSREHEAPYRSVGELSAEENFTVQLVDKLGSSSLFKLEGSKLILVDDQFPKLQLKKHILVKKKNISDVDGDGADDLLLFSKVEETPAWRAFTTGGIDGPVQRTAKYSSRIVTWRVGDNRGVPVVGDYNGDGVLDLATFTPMAGTAFVGEAVNWKIYLSQPPKLTSNFIVRPTEGYLTFNWGHGPAVPVPGDYDGDGATDLGVYYPNDGSWRLMFSSSGFEHTKAMQGIKGFGLVLFWGTSGDIPLSGDFDGDGKADLALWSEAINENEASKLQINFIDLEQNNSKKTLTIEFGAKGEIPVTGDFDCDQKTDIAVYNKKKKQWRVKEADNIKTISWDDRLDVEPLTADYDGDGCDDLATYNPDGYFRWSISPSGINEEGNKYLYLKPKYQWGDPQGLPPAVHLRNYYIKTKKLLEKK